MSGNTSQSITPCPNIPNKSSDEADSSFSSTCSADSHVSDDMSISLMDYSGSSCETVEFSNDSDCGLLEGESIDLFLQEHEAAWQDATSSTTTESHTVTTTAAHNDVTAASLDPPHPIDHQMICDIKTIASRLASKAHQLLGV